MPMIELDRGPLNFAEAGAGPPVLFVHGGCGGGGQWKALAEELSSDHRTLRLDLPGCGDSMDWRDDWTDPMAVDGEAVAAMLDHIAEPAHLVAHSGGCLSAWPAIRAREDRILTLAMFEPTYFHILRQTADPAWAEAEDLRIRYQTAARAGDIDTAMAEFVDRWARREGAWRAMPDGVRRFMRKGAGKLVHQGSLNHREAPTLDDLAALRPPLLFFSGAETIACQRRLMEIIGEGPRGPVEWIAGAGHMAPFTHAAAITPILRAHLAAA